MTASFNPTRFIRLFARHTTDKLRSYGMSLAVLVGVLVLGGGFISLVLDVRLETEVLRALYLLVAVLAGTLFTSTVFSDLGDRRRAVPWLTLPASHLEKCLVAWIYSYLLFILVYSGLYLAVANLLLRLQKDTSSRGFTLWFPEMQTLLAVFSFLQALAFYGAVRFRNLHFIRTGFFFVIAFLIVIMLNHAFLRSLIGIDLDMMPPFTKLRFPWQGRTVFVEPVSESHPLIPIVFTTVLLWVAAYFRITEKEI